MDRLAEWVPTLVDLVLLFFIGGFSGLGMTYTLGKPLTIGLFFESFIKQGSLGAGIGLFIIWKFSELAVAAAIAVILGGGHAGKKEFLQYVRHQAGMGNGS